SLHHACMPTFEPNRTLRRAGGLDETTRTRSTGYRRLLGSIQIVAVRLVAPTIYSGMFTCPPANVMRALTGGGSASGGAVAVVIGGAPGPRGIVWTTWLGGRGRPLRRCSYIRSIAWLK